MAPAFVGCKGYALIVVVGGGGGGVTEKIQNFIRIMSLVVQRSYYAIMRTKNFWGTIMGRSRVFANLSDFQKIRYLFDMIS